MSTLINMLDLNGGRNFLKIVIAFLLFTCLAEYTFPQNGEFNHNYIRTFKPIRNHANSVVPAHNGSDDMYSDKWAEQIVYFDGLGRELQIVNVHSSGWFRWFYCL